MTRQSRCLKRVRNHFLTLFLCIIPLFTIISCSDSESGSGPGSSSPSREGDLVISISDDTISNGVWKISHPSSRDEQYEVKSVNFKITGDQTKEINWQINQSTTIKTKLAVGSYNMTSTMKASSKNNNITVSQTTPLNISVGQPKKIEFGNEDKIDVPTEGVNAVAGAPTTVDVTLYTLSQTPPVNGDDFDQSKFGDTLKLDLSHFFDGTETYELEIFKGTGHSFYTFHEEHFDTRQVFEWKPKGSGYYLFSVFNAASSFVCDAYVKVFPSNNSAPIAMFTVDTEYPIKNQIITLDGSHSVDIDNEVFNYQWTLVTKPSKSTAFITSPASNISTITPDISGLYAIELELDDGNTDTSRNNSSAKTKKEFYVRESADEIVTNQNTFQLIQKAPNQYEVSVTLNDYAWSLIQKNPYVYVDFAIWDTHWNNFHYSYYETPIDSDATSDSIYKHISPKDLPRTLQVGFVDEDTYLNASRADILMEYLDVGDNFHICYWNIELLR